jgi:hypothetical protein
VHLFDDLPGNDVGIGLKRVTGDNVPLHGGMPLRLDQRNSAADFPSSPLPPSENGDVNQRFPGATSLGIG